MVSLYSLLFLFHGCISSFISLKIKICFLKFSSTTFTYVSCFLYFDSFMLLSLHVSGVPCLLIAIQGWATQCWLEPVCLLSRAGLLTERWGMEPAYFGGTSVSVSAGLWGEEASTFLPDGWKPGNSSSGDWLATLPAESCHFSVALYLQLEGQLSWFALLSVRIILFFDSLHILIFSQ